MVEDAAVMATLKGASYPALIIAGTRMEPIPDVSAAGDPEMPANSMLTSTFTWASPPRMCPTRAWDNSSSRSVTFPWFIIMPARRKKGTAKQGKGVYPFEDVSHDDV